MIAILERVDAPDPHLAEEHMALFDWSRSQPAEVKWYQEGAEGASGLSHLLQDLKYGRVSRLVLWAFERLGKNVPQLYDFLEELDANGCTVLCLRDGIDTATAEGQLFLKYLKIMCDCDRTKQSVAIKAGQARVPKRRRGGRPLGTATKCTPEIRATIVRLAKQGVGRQEIARICNVGDSTVYLVLKQEAAKEKKKG